MDLAALWEHVPHLLEVCVCDNIPALRDLRLVSKEASRVALLGLRSFTLMLRGIDGYKTVSGAALLRGTQLWNLDVDLLMSGEGENCMATFATYYSQPKSCSFG